MNLECDLKDELLCYEPDNDDERHCKRRMLAFLEVPQCFERSLDKDHFTASSWLIDKSANKVLLMHHRKLDKWLQLGGHADGDSNLLRVAIKEAQEESGIQDIKPVHKHIFDIDIHDVPGHRHFDVRFLLNILHCKCPIGADQGK